jgi:hypothetical protein
MLGGFLVLLALASVPLASAQGCSAVVNFVPGRIFGCDVAWSTPGVASAESACSAHHADASLCTAAALGHVGMPAGACSSAPAGKAYLTAIASRDASLTSSSCGSATGAGDAWACANDELNGMSWARGGACGALDRVVGAAGVDNRTSVAGFAWTNVSDASGSMTSDGTSGGVLCCVANMSNMTAGVVTPNVTVEESRLSNEDAALLAACKLWQPAACAAHRPPHPPSTALTCHCHMPMPPLHSCRGVWLGADNVWVGADHSRCHAPQVCVQRHRALLGRALCVVDRVCVALASRPRSRPASDAHVDPGTHHHAQHVPHHTPRPTPSPQASLHALPIAHLHRSPPLLTSPHIPRRTRRPPHPA